MFPPDWQPPLEPDCLHAELDVPTPEDPTEFAALATRWLETAAQELGAEHLAALAEGPALPSKSLSRHQGGFGEPGTRWGQLIVSPADRRRQGSLYAWSPKAWDRFLGRMSDVPLTARLELSELEEHGTPGAGVYFSLGVDRDFHSRHSRWTRLTAHLQPRADDDAVWEATAQRWAGFLTDYAASLEVPPAFGYLADDTGNEPYWTPFENAVRLDPSDTLGTDLVRGYSWVTVLSPGATHRVGGVEALAGSGAFSALTPLPGGGIVARATERLADYDEPACRRVFGALASAISPGLPRKAQWGERDRRLIYEDSTESLQSRP